MLVAGESQNGHGRCLGIAQQGQTELKFEMLTGIGAAAQRALESTFFENQRDRLRWENHGLSGDGKIGDVSSDQVDRQEGASIWSVAAFGLVACGDHSMQVGGKDESGVLQRLENAGIRSGL